MTVFSYLHIYSLVSEKSCLGFLCFRYVLNVCTLLGLKFLDTNPSRHHDDDLKFVMFDLTSSSTQRRQWHPTPVLLPGKSHGRRSLVGCSPLGSLRVGHDWATSLSLFTFMCWRRKWQPTPVVLPGESQGRGSLVSCSLWGRTELDMTEAMQQKQQQQQSSTWELQILNWH